MPYTEDDFARHYLPQRPRVLQLCRQMLGNSEDAEDACQEVYIKLWAQRTRLAEVAQPLAFAIRVARNYCLDRLRMSLPIELSLEENLTPEAELEDEGREQREELLCRIEDWSHQLDEPQRSVFRLVHYEGKPHAEVAERLGLTEVNVRVIISRLRKKLKEQISNE